MHLHLRDWSEVDMEQLRGRRDPVHRASSDIFLSLQIGSYFGGELCGIDMDQDGETELLLIGAPLFYGEQRGGRVFIYQKKQVGTRTWNGGGRRNGFPGRPRSQLS